MIENDKNIKGYSAIHKHAVEGDLESVNKLIECGADCEEPTKSGETPLILAIDFRHQKIVKALIDTGALPLPEGHCLYLTVTGSRGCDHNILLSLIEIGIDVNARCEDGKVPIHYVARQGDLAAVKILIEAGADASILDNNANFALRYAASNGWQEMYNYLLPHTDFDLRKIAEKELSEGLIYQKRRCDQQTSSFISAAAVGSIDDISNSIAHGVNVNAVGVNRNTALYIAASWGYTAIVEILLSNGANVDLGYEGLAYSYDPMGGATPLMSAASRGHYEVACLLVEAGASINASTQSGWTALIAAANIGHFEIVQLLLDAGANVNARDNHGDTALSCAKRTKSEVATTLLRAQPDKTYQLLLKRGALE